MRNIIMMAIIHSLYTIFTVALLGWIVLSGGWSDDPVMEILFTGLFCFNLYWFVKTERDHGWLKIIRMYKVHVLVKRIKTLSELGLQLAEIVLKARDDEDTELLRECFHHDQQLRHAITVGVEQLVSLDPTYQDVADRVKFQLERRAANED